MSAWGIGDFRVGEIYYYLGGSDASGLTDAKEGDLFRVGVYPGSSGVDPLPHTYFWGKALMGEMRFLKIPLGLPRAPFRPATEEEIKAFQMTKDIDVSKIDVGWRVQLDAINFNDRCKNLHRVWATVSSATRLGICVIDDLEGIRRDLDRNASYFLAALSPEPAKDPFAVGEWVVAMFNGAHINEGQIVQIAKPIGGRVGVDHFFADGWYLMKRRFRPATPEEIAAHMEKKDMAGKPVIPDDADPKPLTSEDCELKITPSVPIGADENAKEKITFTVGKREFFVEQRVYAAMGVLGCCIRGDQLVVLGETEIPGKIAVRKPDSLRVFLINSNLVSGEQLHEWQFGDQASHPDHGKVIVIQITESEGFICANPSDPDIFIDPSELTFIRRTDLGE